MNISVNSSINNNKYSAKASFFGSLAYALLLAYLPTVLFSDLDLMATEAVSIVASVLSAFTIIKLAGSARPFLSMLIPAGIFFFVGGSFTLIALFFTMLVTVSLLACLLCKASGFVAGALPILLTAAVYLAASLVLESFTAPLVCLAFLPAALLLSLCISKKVSRVNTVCAAAFGLLLPWFIAFGIWFFYRLGGSLANLSAAIDYARSSLSAMLTSALTEIGTMLDIEANVSGFSSYLVDTR